MIKSMTGYGKAEIDFQGARLIAELSAVNNKGLDLRVNLPPELQFADHAVRNYVKKSLARGSVNCRITMEAGEDTQAAVEIDENVMASYVRSMKKVLEREGLPPTSFDAARLVSLPGAIRSRKIDEEMAKKALLQLLEKAVKSLLDSRSEEGVSLQRDMLERCELMQQYRIQIEGLVKEAVANYREKLFDRIRSAGLEELGVDDERLEKEVVIYSDRTDVTEEVVRLKAHLQRFAELLQTAEPVGRDLNFLAQEIGREINTTGSKSQNSQIAALIVSFKTELERCREQIQNVE